MTAHFFTSASLSRIAAMNEAECQVEGWWKGEIIWLLGQLKKTGAVKAWDRECRSVNGRQDFEIELANTIAGIEVKTALCGSQKGHTWDLPWYAKDPKRFFPPDIRKLAAIQAPNRYFLVFAHASPPNTDWQVMLNELRRSTSGIA